MKRLLQFMIVLAVAMALVPSLPLYIERTMMRSWLVDHGGTIIEWGWKRITLNSYWSDYVYFDREQQPALWLAVNLALAFTYALLIALTVDQVLARWTRRQGRFPCQNRLR
jgi:hypothetical protein